MKLEELYKPKIAKKVTSAALNFYNDEDDDRSSRLEKALSKLEWYPLGEGYYSKVFCNEHKDYVLKINTLPDPAYQYYVKTIKKYCNPHFPRISNMKELKVDGNTYYVYVIEKLHKIRMSTQDFTDAVDISNILRYISKQPNTSLNKLWNDVPEYLLERPLLVKAARIVGRNLKSYSFDLHSKNIMQRNDGTIVITDPYS